MTTITLSPVDLVLRVCNATEGATEIPANTNSGPYVERVLALCGLHKGDPWCACEVANIGLAALDGQWPVPKTGGCQALYEWGVSKRITRTEGQKGDIFVIWHASLGRFAHTGFLISDKRDDDTFKTHEGNTSGGGSREGWIVAHRARAFAPKDRFIRWSELVT